MQLQYFGPFCLDLAGRQLTRDGTPVPLFPKVFDTLAVLVESGGAVLSKEELMERIWPGTFVQESNLTQNIFLLRKALGGDGDERYIQTVPRRGYRFAANVIAGDETPVAGRPRLRVRRWLVAAVAVLAAAVFGFSRYARSTQPRMSIEKLTSEGKAYEPAISPDGKLVAYKVIDHDIDHDTETIRLRDLAKGSSIQVMPPSAVGYHALTFSPDGNEIFFRSYRPGVKNGLIFRVPIFGGTPQEVAREIWSDFSVSPDGKEVAFIRGPSGSEQVIAARTDGSGERVVGRGASFHMWDSGPAWSPDGHRLALCGVTRDAHEEHGALFAMDARSGAVAQIPLPPWESVVQSAWLPDGNALLVVAQERSGSPAQLWFVDSVTGNVQRVTNDVSEYGKMKISADGRQVVVEQRGSEQHLWRLHDGDAMLTAQLTSGPADDDGRAGVSWTRDGRVLFASNRTGEYEIWSMKPDGSDARPLTTSSSAPNRFPKATPDGRYIVFSSSRDGHSRIWRVDADGRNPVELTRGESDLLPDVSPDSHWVFYTDASATPSRIAKISIDGGPAMPLTCAANCGHPVLSPDGTTVAFESFDDVRGWRTGVMPADGGAARLFDWHAFIGVVCWTPDSRNVIYLAKNGNLWLQPIAGGAPRPLTHLARHRIWNAAISPDGKDFVVVAGEQWSDIVRITGIR